MSEIYLILVFMMIDNARQIVFWQTSWSISNLQSITKSHRATRRRKPRTCRCALCVGVARQVVFHRADTSRIAAQSSLKAFTRQLLGLTLANLTPASITPQSMVSSTLESQQSIERISYLRNFHENCRPIPRIDQQGKWAVPHAASK